MKIRRLLFALPALCLLLAACESPLPEVSYPELRFNHLPLIELNVARIDIVEKYHSPLQRPHVEHEIPLAPAKAMRNWANDRLRAVGSSGRATFIIVEASVKAAPLAKKKGLKAAFTLDQAARYDARLEARLEVETAAGLGKGFATATAARHRTMPEAVSINARDDALYNFVEGAAMDFNRVMTTNIDRHLTPFIRPK
ncbi:MAG: hypothetical protein HOA08_12135 [Rhodospirillaceae bacterium]|jgi:hypothetical protein|nr:hypothetical protein [Rhodospirillaceae bacterium]MBT3494733.1 hypothetical protein [Rhodospirillaceae bacterium]MBT3779088.1 hypothetical protein [Rhodospirillaceae bacterium]MBT3976607.1 hypothetical protein [Rhodospirillaceae bacterium]MBT4168728.1 hypothetical protein [Rhodospirillaceae bacterium]